MGRELSGGTRPAFVISASATERLLLTNSAIGEGVKALKESTYFHRALDDNSLTQRVADIGFQSEFTSA